MEKSNGYLSIRTFIMILGILITTLIVVFGVIGNVATSADNKAVESLTAIAGIKQVNTNVERRLDRIEEKLDRLLLK